MLRLLKLTGVTTFVLYWVITFFFNAPDNYLKIKLNEQSDWFQFFMFQRWNFFAPPPNYNDRLYLVYKKNSDPSSKKVIEVFETLYKKKHEKTPFNYREDLMDYLLSNSVSSLTDEVINEANFQNYLDLQRKERDTGFYSYIELLIQTSDNFKTLLNYSLIVAKEKEINLKYDSVQILMTKKFIPIFAERGRTDSLSEQVVYKSKYYKL